MDVSAWLTDWLELYVQPRGLRPRTMEYYERCCRIAGEQLQGVQLEELTPITLRRVVVNMQRVHPRSAEQISDVLRAAMRCARECGLSAPELTENNFPTLHHQIAERAVLDDAAIAAYREAALADSHRNLLLLALLGLRRGELLGLKWGDISSDGVLHVQRQRQRIAGKMVEAPLKSRSGDRYLQIPGVIIALLLRDKRALPSAYVVDTTPDALRKAHMRTLKRAGLEKTGVTLHGLRHSFATAAIRHGAGLKPLSDALGHSGITLAANLYGDHFRRETSTVGSVALDML